MRVQGDDGLLHAKEAVLQGNQLCPQLDLRLSASRIVRK